MKKSIIIIIVQVVLINCNLWSQKHYNQFYQTYRYNHGVESFDLSASLFRFLLTKNEIPDKFNNISNVSFFTSNTNTSKLLGELHKHLPNAIYKNLIEIKDGNSTIIFKVKQVKNGIEEVLMIVEEPESLFVLCISGFLSQDEAQSIINSIDINKSTSITNTQNK